MRSHLAKVYLVAPLLLLAAFLSVILFGLAFAMHHAEQKTKAKLKPVEHIVIAPESWKLWPSLQSESSVVDMKTFLQFAAVFFVFASCASAQNLGYVSESATNGSNYTAGVQYDSQNCDAWVRCNYSSEFCTAGQPQDQLHRKFVLISRTYQGESEQTEHWRLDFKTPQFWESYTITDANIGPAFIYDNKLVCDGWHNDAIDFGIDFRQISAPTAADFELSKKLKAAMQSSK